MCNKEVFNNWAVKQKLEKRQNAVGICWQTINNAQLIKMGISPNSCENWKDMFTILETGGFKESYYISDLMRIYFGNINLGTIPGDTTFYGANSDNRRKLNKLFELRNKFDKDADTIIFTSVGNDIHTELKKLIFNVMDKTEYYDIMIMDGGSEDRDGTNNASCEEKAKLYSKEARKHGKKMIFISSQMGTRSWSNKFVKNVFLLFDSGSFDTNNQRIARCWTPWDSKHNTCYIFDFRLTYEYPPISEKFITGTLINKEKYTEESVTETIGKIASSDKIEFIDVYGNVDNPFRNLSVDDMKEMVLSNRNFNDYVIEKNFVLDDITDPLNIIEDIYSVNKRGLESENTKGDYEKTIKRKIKSYTGKNKNDKSDDEVELILKIKYIEFIKNNGILFNPEQFKENVVNQIYDNIDNYKELIEDPECLDMTFQTVKDIIYQFKKCPINFDKLFIWE